MLPILIVTLALAQAAAEPQTPRGTAGTNDPIDALHVQVLLDRAGFSPGVIDGQMGANTKRALAAFERAGHRLTAGTPPTVSYVITSEDVAGPFTRDIPAELPDQAKLPYLGYRTPLEMIAERFHASPALLQKLNPGVSFREGDEILVPNVEVMIIPAPAPEIDEKKPRAQAEADRKAAEERMAARPDVTVTVSKSGSDLTVTDASGKVLLYAPVTTGSARDPLPIGEWKVNGVGLSPEFRYNPDLFWDADPAHTKALLPPGPNNPVGLVWIDLSKEHYGIHGTPEPAQIGRAESHGCVRLTNWDALHLAGLVKPGTRVIFKE
jgi:lipoprotein-anchoring transpeptidase ErfK/SrfK